MIKRKQRFFQGCKYKGENNMSLTVMQCPNCHGEVQVDDSRDFGFCMYCGSKIQLKTKVEIENENSENNMLKRGKSFLKLNNIDKARETFEKINDLYPECAEAKLELILINIGYYAPRYSTEKEAREEIIRQMVNATGPQLKIVGDKLMIDTDSSFFHWNRDNPSTVSGLLFCVSKGYNREQCVMAVENRLYNGNYHSQLETEFDIVADDSQKQRLKDAVEEVKQWNKEWALVFCNTVLDCQAEAIRIVKEKREKERIQREEEVRKMQQKAAEDKAEEERRLEEAKKIIVPQQIKYLFTPNRNLMFVSGARMNYQTKKYETRFGEEGYIPFIYYHGSLHVLRLYGKENKIEKVVKISDDGIVTLFEGLGFVKNIKLNYGESGFSIHEVDPKMLTQMNSNIYGKENNFIKEMVKAKHCPVCFGSISRGVFDNKLKCRSCRIEIDNSFIRPY